jgi:hypothetical protein
MTKRANPGRRALHEHRQAGQILGIAAQLDAPTDQSRVDLVAVADQRDLAVPCDHARR